MARSKRPFKCASRPASRIARRSATYRSTALTSLDALAACSALITSRARSDSFAIVCALTMMRTDKKKFSAGVVIACGLQPKTNPGLSIILYIKMAEDDAVSALIDIAEGKQTSCGLTSKGEQRLSRRNETRVRVPVVVKSLFDDKLREFRMRRVTDAAECEDIVLVWASRHPDPAKRGTLVSGDCAFVTSHVLFVCLQFLSRPTSSTTHRACISATTHCSRGSSRCGRRTRWNAF